MRVEEHSLSKNNLISLGGEIENRYKGYRIRLRLANDSVKKASLPRKRSIPGRVAGMVLTNLRTPRSIDRRYQSLGGGSVCL